MSEGGQTADPGHRSPLRRVIWWGSLAYAPILLWAELGISYGAIATFVSDWLSYLPLLLAATWSLWDAARHGPDLGEETRKVVRMLAGAIGLLSIGNIGYTWTYVIQERSFETWSVGEPFFLGGYALLLIALLRIPSRHPRRYPSWQAILDTLIVVVGAAALGWDLVVQPTIAGEQSISFLLIRAAYPIFGAAFLLALNATRGGGGALGHHPAWRCLAVAVVAYVTADGFYQLINYTASSPAWYWWISATLYVMAYLCLQDAGRLYRTSRHVPETSINSHRPVTFSPLPIAAVSGVLVLLVSRVSGSWESGVSELGIALAILVVLLLIRQHRTSLENDRLVRAEVGREGEVRATALLRHARAVVLMTDVEQRIQFITPSAVELLGTTPVALLGIPLATLIHPDDLTRFEAALRPPGTRGSDPVDLRLQCGDGTHRELNVIVTDLADEPAVRGTVLFARDMSEQRILQSRLQQAEKLEAVGKLAGGIAHDFNNLLTTILAEAELLLVEDPTNEGLRALRESATMGADLTRQLLTFARRQVPAARPIDVIELASTSLRMLGKLHSHIRLEFEAPESVPLVDADPQQLRQALLNLLFNARDAMPDGGTLSVSVSREVVTRPFDHTQLPVAVGSYVQLRVADTGVGMTPSVIEQAFEPFFTTKAVGRGTGLGLPSVLGILQQHGAGLRVQSVPGEGTTIEIYLPESVEHDEEATLETPAAHTAAIRGNERLLLVDDETAVRDVTRRMLERLGYEVRTAAGGDEARRALSDNWVPDLLVTDVAMPKETGPQLALALRKILPRLPILFVSGYTAGELADGGALDEAMAFVSKPYTPTELGLQVRALFDRQDPI